MVWKKKENEKIDKYLYLVKELMKLWNMKVKEIAIVFDDRGKVPKGLENRLGELQIKRMETIQTTA